MIASREGHWPVILVCGLVLVGLGLFIGLLLVGELVQEAGLVPLRMLTRPWSILHMIRVLGTG